MKEIKVKICNQKPVIEALQSRGFQAEECDTPTTDSDFNGISFINSREQDEILDNRKTQFTGVRTSASGNQCHKVIQDLKNKGLAK